jgi:class 3 adenylate cyclase
MDYAMQAGRRAMASVAFEDATHHFDMALQALELSVDENPARRAEILLEIAEAHMYAAAAPAALEASDEAAAIGASLGRFDLVGRAALHRARHNYLALTVTDQKLVEIALTAIDGLADDDEHRSLRARVLGTFALHVSSTEPVRARALAEESVAEWRLAPDPEALHDAMRAIVFLAGSVSDPDGLLRAPAFEGLLPDGGSLTLVRAEALLAELRPGDDLSSMFEAAMRRFYIAVRDGDGPGYTEAITDIEQLAAASRSPSVQTNAGYYAGVAEIIRGNYEAGSAAMRTFSKNCRAYGFNSDMLNNVGISLVPMLREQGGLQSLLEPTRDVVARLDHEAWSGSLALILAEVGLLDEATAMVEDVVIGAPERLGGDVVISFARAMYAEVAATIGHRAAAEVLLDLMSDDGAASVSVGPYSYYGAMDRYRGRLLAVLDRHDEAVAMQRRAITYAERMFSRPWIARGQFDLATSLLARGDPADRAEAVSLLNTALVAATEIGMTRLMEEVTLQKLVLQGVGPDVEVGSSIAMIAESVNLDVLVRAGAENPTLTLLFSDIVGYTQMTERLGDEAAHRILRRHNDALRGALRAHNGTEVKSEGDGFMLTFESVLDACRFAIEFNRRLAALELDSGAGRVRVRMGIHTGDVIRDDDDFFGRTVIVAARIAAMAGGDEVLLSSVATAAAAAAGLALGDARMLSLKGLAGEHEVCMLQLGSS